MDREQALDTALGQIERQFGKGAVMKMNDAGAGSRSARFSTGNRSRSTSRSAFGGLPRRGGSARSTARSPPVRTTLVYHVIAEAQRRGGNLRLHRRGSMQWTRAYAKRIGRQHGRAARFPARQRGEQALEICELLVRSGRAGPSSRSTRSRRLTPKAEIEGEMGDSHVGLQARLMSQALRKAERPRSTRRTRFCLFTNQLRREDRRPCSAARRRHHPAAGALRFYASIRLDIRRIETLKEGVEGGSAKPCPRQGS